MNPNARPSERVAICNALNPISSVAVQTGGWVAAKDFYKFLAIIQAGVIGAAATVDAKLQQATDSAGTGVKDITGKAITQFTKAGTDDNKQAEINCNQTDLDIANGFTHLRLVITPATAASLVAGLLLGFDARLPPASDTDASTVDEIVG